MTNPPLVAFLAPVVAVLDVYFHQWLALDTVQRMYSYTFQPFALHTPNYNSNPSIRWLDVHGEVRDSILGVLVVFGRVFSAVLPHLSGVPYSYHNRIQSVFYVSLLFNNQRRAYIHIGQPKLSKKFTPENSLMETTSYTRIKDNSRGGICFCWPFRRGKGEEEEAESIFDTIRKINDMMGELQTKMAISERNMDRKLTQITKYKESNRLVEARSCLRVYKQYEASHQKFHAMQQNLEVLKIKIQEAHSAMVMIDGLGVTTRTLEDFTKTLNFEKLDSLLDDYMEYVDDNTDIMGTITSTILEPQPPLSNNVVRQGVNGKPVATPVEVEVEDAFPTVPTTHVQIHNNSKLLIKE